MVTFVKGRGHVMGVQVRIDTQRQGLGGLIATPEPEDRSNLHQPNTDSGMNPNPERIGAMRLDDRAHQNHAMFAAMLRTVNERDRELEREPEEFIR